MEELLAPSRLGDLRGATQVDLFHGFEALQVECQSAPAHDGGAHGPGCRDRQRWPVALQIAHAVEQRGADRRPVEPAALHVVAVFHRHAPCQEQRAVEPQGQHELADHLLRPPARLAARCLGLGGTQDPGEHGALHAGLPLGRPPALARVASLDEIQVHRRGLRVHRELVVLHPVADGIEPFSVEDECYRHLAVADDAAVLLTAEEDGETHVLGWTRTDGDARVAYSALGHDQRSLEEPAHQRFLQHLLAWLTGEGPA
ncbi:MAG: ThuA domain-containing protein [Acidimicrobiales bacterium]